MKPRYEYHVTYQFPNGSGRMNYQTDSKIKSEKAVMELADYIKKEHAIDEVVVTNWIRLKFKKRN